MDFRDVCGLGASCWVRVWVRVDACVVVFGEFTRVSPHSCFFVVVVAVDAGSIGVLVVRIAQMSEPCVTEIRGFLGEF